MGKIDSASYHSSLQMRYVRDCIRDESKQTYPSRDPCLGILQGEE